MTSTAIQLNPRELLKSQPSISAAEFMEVTGLKRRSYFKYRSAMGLTAQRTDSASASPEASEEKRQARPRAPRTYAAPSEVVSNSTGKWMLYAVFGAATVASVHNMFSVMAELTAEPISAFSLTAVFACTAIAFTGAGMKDRFTLYLIIALIAFEAFCNAANMYGWLYDFTTHTATHFLQRVQSLIYFISAQHCAVVLSMFTASCIAGVQYAALRELKKRTA